MIQAKAGRTSEVQVLSSSQSCESPRQGKLTETCLHILLRWHDGLDCREDCFTSEQRAARRGESSQHLMQSNKT